MYLIFRIFVVSLLFVSSAAFGADIYCVAGDGAVGDAALVNALTLASVRAQQFGSDAEIRIHQRAAPYVLDSAPTSNFGEVSSYRGLTLYGGYSDGSCSSAREINPLSTSIDVQMDFLDLIGDGDVLVDGIRFLGNATMRISSESNKTTVKRSIFNNGVNFYNLNQDDDFIFNYYIYSNVFVGSAGCGLYLSDGLSANNVNAFVVNNTIVNNQSGVCADGEKLKMALFNNIVWLNANYGIRDDDVSHRAQYSLAYNVIQPLNNISNIVLDQNNISSSPDFVAPQNGDFHLSLSPKSPAIDSASDSLPGGMVPGADIEGAHRPAGLHVDRGAYESPFNNVGNVVTVTTNSDLANPGQGKVSLRGAIIQANQSNVPFTIKFNIPSPDCGSPAQTITLNSLLPDISQSVVIDGYTQDNARYNTSTTGFTADTCITVVNNAYLASAFRVPSSATSVQLNVSGLRIVGFVKAIDLQGGGTHLITGNNFLRKNGYSPNTVDVQVTGSAYAIVGGADVAERNLLASASDTAVSLGSDNNVVSNNLIGPGPAGILDANATNMMGVRIVNADGNGVIGNTISGNQTYGVDVTVGSHSSYIQNNLVGINDGGTCGFANCGPDDDRSLPNAIAGIHFDVTSTQNFVFGNEVAYNPVGVCIASNKVAMVGNRIHDSGSLGVDLDAGSAGMAACAGNVAPVDNDVANSPSSPNGGQNFPSVLWAGGEDGSGLVDGKVHDGHVRGQLASKDGNFTLYIYASKKCGPQRYGDGEELIGSVKVTVNDAGTDNGIANFDSYVSSKLVLTGRFVTMQARDDATGNISEFSRCVSFVRDSANPAFDDRLFVDSFEAKPTF